MKENGRQRAAKIDRLYHAAFDRFIYRKRWMGFLGLVVGLAYSAWLLMSPTGALHVTTGDLSQPHFAWNKTGCENCHVPNIPIRKDAWGGELITNISQNNNKCNGSCHAVTGHFESKIVQSVLASESCGTCHREHLGFDRSLVEVSDSDCSRCHANVASVTIPIQSGNANAKEPVTNFSKEKGHPEFASLTEPDPGTIRFSHVQHMRPGQPKAPGGGDAKQLKMLPKRFRTQYENRVDSEQLIQLTCSDCHSRDIELKGYEGLELASVTPSSAAIQSSSHMLYKPIEFDKHCVACHDLDGIPHGLDRALTTQAINEVIPAKLLDFLKSRDKASDVVSIAEGKLSIEMAEELSAREKRLKAVLHGGETTCLKCHQKSNDPEFIVSPSKLNKHWLREASFTHGAHLMVSCKECHQGAYDKSDDVFDLEKNTNSEDEASKVMIRGIANCRTCHIQDAEERSRLFGEKKHVASADCADCHRYHSDPPKSLPSAGKSALSASISLSEIQPFLANETSP